MSSPSSFALSFQTVKANTMELPPAYCEAAYDIDVGQVNSMHEKLFIFGLEVSVMCEICTAEYRFRSRLMQYLL